MASVRYLTRTLAVLLGLGQGSAGHAAEANVDQFGELLRGSPFGQKVSANTASAAAATPVELRGMVMDHGEALFSVYESTTRVSRWVGLNEAGNPFTVRSYDSAKGEAKIEYQGRELSLAFKQAKVVALPPPPLPPGPTAGPVPAPAMGNGPQPVMAAGGIPSDEAVRLAQVAEEIRRRRALRQQGRQQSVNPPIPPPSK